MTDPISLPPQKERDALVKEMRTAANVHCHGGFNRLGREMQDFADRVSALPVLPAPQGEALTKKDKEQAVARVDAMGGSTDSRTASENKPIRPLLDLRRRHKDCDCWDCRPWTY